jgi:hypothetical protein
MEKNDGGPAFPRTMWTGHKDNSAHRDIEGMTLRDYFAAKAMQGILAVSKPNGEVFKDAKTVAIFAYQQADAMIEVRDDR